MAGSFAGRRLGGPPAQGRGAAHGWLIAALNVGVGHADARIL
ncbi:hypothetical protein AB5J52_48580 (plasmid) [Streptomyces sp. R39]|uniref:Uncharacterized protein n=1 Tax=Streptomyces sp. R39 TaxID=3238631 RepID=A0AB39R6K2_9ACTN